LPDGGCLNVPNVTSPGVGCGSSSTTARGGPALLIDEEFSRKPQLQPVLQWAPPIPIDRRTTRSSSPGQWQIEAGNSFAFPEGQLSVPAHWRFCNADFEMIGVTHSTGGPVFLDQLWGSIFSFRGGKFFRMAETFSYGTVDSCPLFARRRRSHASRRFS